MSATPPASVAAALQALRERFRASSTNTFAALRAIGGRLTISPDAADAVEDLRRELHRVHGTAGTFGYAEASRLAGTLERRAVRWAGDPALDRSERATIVEHFVRALELAFEMADAPAADADPRRRVLAVALPADLLGAVRAEGELRGYRVESVTLDGFTIDALRAAAPHLVTTSPAAHDRAARTVGTSGVPVVVIGAPPAIEPGALNSTVSASAIYVEDAGALFAGADRLAARGDWAGGTILVVDDDPSILTIVRYLVEAPELRVVTVEDTDDLTLEVSRHLASLVLIDVNLGERDGIALVAAMRAQPGGGDVPVIVFSSDADAATRARAYEAGADEFVAKPIVPAELRRRVADRLERLRLRRLADGLHPTTGLPLDGRAVAEKRYALLRGEDRLPAVAIIRPLAEQSGGRARSAWLRESSRLAHTMRPVAAGYVDRDGMTMLLRSGADAAELALSALAAAQGPDEPRWRAGIADGRGAGSSDFAIVYAAADDASARSRVAGDGQAASDAVHSHVSRWMPESSGLAPDIVIVEDDLVLVEMLEFALRASGLSTRSYRNGPEALAALLAMRSAGRRPIVILDVDLPGLDGHTLHERLRAERPGEFGVVFVTVHNTESEQVRALRGGALDYIAKPVNLRVLLAKIPQWRERVRA